MSLVKDALWAACPTTTRGRPTPLSADPKGERIAYPSNKSIFLRSIDSPALSTQYVGHTTTTTVAKFSPSGYYVASGDASGLVRVWDCAGEGTTKGEFPIINGPINDLAWDFESKRIIAVGEGKERFGHCITADSGNTVGEITGHSRPINAVSIRPQRPLRATTVGDDNTIVFMTGAPFRFSKNDATHTRFVYGVADSPDGAHVVTVGADRQILLFDGKSHDFKTKIGENEHTGSIFGVSWSKDSRRFVTASADQTVKIWDVETGKSVQTWRLGHDQVVSVPDQQVGVVWPSGRSDGLVISLGLNGYLHYLHEGKQKPTKTIQGHQKAITAMSSGIPNGKTLWTGSYDGRVSAWDTTTGEATVLEDGTHKNKVTAMTATQTHIHSIGMDDTLRAVDPRQKIFLGKHVALKTLPVSLAATQDRVLVVTGDTIVLYNTNGIQVGELKVKFELVYVAASPQGSLVAVAGADQVVRLYTRDDSQLTLKHTLPPVPSAVTAMALSPDSSLLAIGCATGKIFVYDTKTHELKTDRWSAHSGRCTTIAWNEANTHAVSGSLDTNVFVWSLKEPGKRVKALNAHKDGVYGVGWLEGGTKVASSGADATVKIWTVSL